MTRTVGFDWFEIEDFENSQPRKIRSCPVNGDWHYSIK